MRKMIGALAVVLLGVVLIGAKTITTLETTSHSGRQEDSIAEAAGKVLTGGNISDDDWEGDLTGRSFIQNNLIYEVTEWNGKQLKGEVSVVGLHKGKKANIPETVTDPENVSAVYQVTSIADDAFRGRKTLVSVQIPASVKHIGRSVFTGDKKLQKITVDKDNSYYKTVDNALLTKSGRTLLAVVETGSVYLIPKGIKNIREGAFVYCSNLEKLRIPATIQKLGVILDDAAPNLKTLEFCGKEVPEILPGRGIHKGTDVASQHMGLEIVMPKGTKAAYSNVLKQLQWDVSLVELKANPNSDKPKVYLTFDDGPSTNTEQILEILKKYNVHATFFVLGKTDTASKKLYQKIIEGGHSLGVHSTSHNYKKVYASQNSFEEDYLTTRDLLWKVTGIKPTLYRFPGGSNNGFGTSKERQKNIKFIKKQGAVHYDWNACNDDSIGVSYSPSRLVQNALRGINKSREANILLMHDAPAKKNTVKSLPQLIQILLERGYALEAMDEYIPQVSFAK